MSASWVVRATASKEAVERALEAHSEIYDPDDEMAVTGFEASPDWPDLWHLEAYLPRKPRRTDGRRIGALFGNAAPKLEVEKLAETDWVLVSQTGMEPVEAGRFRIRTPDFPPASDARVREFVIPAAQAFGTGHHETTAGCLMMLQAMRAGGVRLNHIADVGTGTGVLAFAAHSLWPRANIVASDNDPLSVAAVVENARLNGISLGSGSGEILPLEASGLQHDRIIGRAPFDAIIANILAGPLIGLAPDFAAGTVPGSHVLLAGLLQTQEAQVRSAYRRNGFRLARRLVGGDWSILWLRRRG